MITVSDDVLSRQQWEGLFAQAGQSALVQSWAYGEVKRSEGWLPRRLLISRNDGTAVALAQVLERRIVGLFRIARLNRGPVWLGDISDDDKLAVIQAVCRRWRLFRAAVLFVAPELPMDLVPRLNMIRRKAPAWGSAWIDLSQPAETLRKRLDGKWRNMLVGAERAGLRAEVSSGITERSWLLERYAELMRDKGFVGMPPGQIEVMTKFLYQSDDLLTIRAFCPENQAVGGILLARHGVSATYLVGWNGDAGRKMKANNFLLWQAILALQGLGSQWLDLGGIDDVLTPGIAAFKRGMKGVEYQLAGEFLSL